MINEFIGNIFKEGTRNFIKVPFNVWEEWGKKGSIPVRVSIKEEVFECKLLPKGNGSYYIPVSKKDAEKIDQDEKLIIELEEIETLTRINSNSPYSLDNPVRKINSIESVTEPGGMCGQGCIAMLTGIKMDEIVKLMGKQSSMSKVIEALDYYGIGHAARMIYNVKRDTVLPKCCIINAKGHMLIYFDNRFYDSNGQIYDEYDYNNITGYMEIML